MDHSTEFEAERTRLTNLATQILHDPAEAEDIVQTAWIRIDRTETPIDNLPAWLTTVTTRLCLDRLRARVPEASEPVEQPAAGGSPEDEAVLADSVGVALGVVLNRLSPTERVAFILHDTFAYPFDTIATVLDTSPAAARKLASRARAKVHQPVPEDRLAQWEIVDAFMAAARHGDLGRLLELLAPDAVVSADTAALQLGTPSRIEGRDEIAAFFNGAAQAALPVFVGPDAGAAWYDKGRARVLFDFTTVAGKVRGIVFRADPEVLSRVVRRRADSAAR